MLKRYSEVFRSGLLIMDLLLVASSWLAAYWIRFYGGLPVPKGIPPIEPYLTMLIGIVPLWFFLLRARGLYKPRRTETLLPEVASVFGATAVGVLLLVALSFFTRSYFYSRGVILLFFCLSFVSVSVARLSIRTILRWGRRRGFNLRYVLVAGSGNLAHEVIERIHAHPEAGLRVVGVLSDDSSVRAVNGVPVLGRYASVKEVLAAKSVDQVVLALPREDFHYLEKLLAELDDEFVSVRLVPDLLHVLTLRSSVEDLDGLPMIGLRDTPLVGWAAVQKRVFDLVVVSLAMIPAAPLMGCVALAIWVTSGRPILYVQERMGLDGRVFRMFKFRTMRPDAERETGPVWTSREDERRTRLGAFLRRTSLDELPQLWNVWRGDMSLVGPRPERPILIERFRADVPGYMLRHKVKAGVTGWAQVNGWRGDSSLHERIEHDLYYIQNWSLGLDLRILLLTFWRGFRNRNAY